MASDTSGSQILTQERWAIELLARETRATIDEVREVYLEEYEKLAAGAHIKTYLPLLTGNLVRMILNGRNTKSDEASKL